MTETLSEIHYHAHQDQTFHGPRWGRILAWVGVIALVGAGRHRLASARQQGPVAIGQKRPRLYADHL